MSEHEALLREMYAEIKVVEERTRSLPALEARITSLERTRARLFGLASLIGGAAGSLATMLKDRLM